MDHATYVGSKPVRLRGHTALLLPHPTDSTKVLAQFDRETTRGDNINLSLRWHAFDASEFKVDEKEAGDVR